MYARPRFDLSHDDSTDYSGVFMSNKNGGLFRASFASHWASNQDGEELKLHPFMDMLQKCDPFTGLFDDNKFDAFFKQSDSFFSSS